MSSNTGTRKLYEQVSDSLADAIGRGAYRPGLRLPTERELAEEFAVSRPTIREAMLALQLRGLVEARHGSGIYVLEQPMAVPKPSHEENIGAFELLEARALIEGETAALAATVITDPQLEELGGILEQMAQENEGDQKGEEADRRFHLAIAAATGNPALSSVVENLWDLRYRAPACHETLSRARRKGMKPRLDTHRAVYDALSVRDPQAARTAMRRHLEAVIDEIVATAEVEAVERAREAATAQRSEITRRRAI